MRFTAPGAISVRTLPLSSVMKTFARSAEEEVGDEDGGDDAREVGEEAAGDGMPRLTNTDGAEVERQDIERRVARALHDAGEPADKRIRTMRVHGVHHHAARAAPTERLHDRRRERR